MAKDPDVLVHKFYNIMAGIIVVRDVCPSVCQSVRLSVCLFVCRL